MKSKLLKSKETPIGLCVAMAIALFGCLPLSESNIPPSTQNYITPNLENTNTAIPLPTRKPTATFAPTQTPLPAQTDLPTIIPGNINNMIESLHSMCKLPCWGNIIPGKTNQYAAKRYLSPFGEWRTSSVAFEYNNSRTSINLTFEHGLVTSIHLYPALTSPYRINQLLMEYGQPEDIQIEVVPVTAELTTWFNLILLYPSQGFFAVFSAEGMPNNTFIYICPRNVSPDLYLLASNTYELHEMNKILSVVHPHMDIQPLNVLTNLDRDQFYEIFRSQNATCVPTNVKY